MKVTIRTITITRKTKFEFIRVVSGRNCNGDLTSFCIWRNWRTVRFPFLVRAKRREYTQRIDKMTRIISLVLFLTWLRDFLFRRCLFLEINKRKIVKYYR